MKLSATEETLMHHLWSRERAFMKDLLDAYDDPKPAATTVATLLKRMTDKGLIAYREYGNSREYYPLITRQAYFATHVNGLVKKFFNNSAAQFASFFTTQAGLSTEELESLQKIIEEQLKKKKP
ncbi:BlaI/MecI/CopY family transcriptional regulator [Hymenobacter aerilatus]|uniref:BlaI/MecI/CopY family transcriptional regulator n=1 Tax=Hymenobacter aerilatus TaxID=2932251 RepID=A0A8T9SQB7_9BACT|nr:BlaI/MecI/CopY family transcriptional regulator [Hymenobacter aerilatus]UOR03985.1 BlaI/MecI/CopY family transcriptional regulator [Hymenobacter aerilatus]